MLRAATPTISQIVRTYKSLVTRELKETIWQRNYYEHIIRNDKEYIMIKQYIIENPNNWDKDEYKSNHIDKPFRNSYNRDTKSKKNERDKIGQWMIFLDNPNQEEVGQIMGKNEKIREAIEELEAMSDDEELRRIADLREKGRREHVAAMEYATEEGWNKGLKEGKKEGKEEGKKEGIKEGKISVAKKLIKCGMTTKEIQEITGLEEDEIESLKK